MVNPATRFNGKTKIDALHIDSSAWYIDGEQVIVSADEINQAAKTYPIYNATGGTTSPGMPLHISGYDATSGYFKVEQADADAGKPCQLFAINSTAKNLTTDAKTYYVGTGNGIDCSGGAAIGDPVYLSATAGTLTLTKPTAANAFVQIVGRVGSLTNPGILELDASFQEISAVGTNEYAALSVGTAALAAKSVTAAKLGSDVAGAGLSGGNGSAIALNTAKIHMILAAGTGKDTTVSVTGMAVGDTIVSVFEVDFTGGSITDTTSQYTAAAASMTKVGDSSTGKTLMIYWIDITA